MGKSYKKFGKCCYSLGNKSGIDYQPTNHSGRGNIPNNPVFKFTDQYLFDAYDIKWENDSNTTSESINQVLELNPNELHIKICKKQLE